MECVAGYDGQKPPHPGYVRIRRKKTALQRCFVRNEFKRFFKKRKNRIKDFRDNKNVKKEMPDKKGGMIRLRS